MKELAKALSRAALVHFQGMKGTPWKDAAGRVREALRACVVERYPKIPSCRLDEILDKAFEVTDSGIFIRFEEIAAALIEEAPTDAAL